MLKKIKVSGYKSLDGQSVSLSPLTVFLGKNNVGKSNFFDALRLLSNVAKMPVTAAFAQGNHRGDATESFSSETNEAVICFEAELDLSAADHPFEKKSKLKHVHFTYTIEIRFNRQQGVLTVGKETLSGKTENGKKSKLFIEHQSGRTVVNRDEGKGNNRKFESPSVRSVLLMIDDAELYPSVCAVREELSSWKFFHFEPNALREPSQKINLTELEESGRGLSGFYDTLARTDPKRFQAALAGLRRAIPEADKLDLVETGDNRRLLRLISKSGKEYTARVISDGTLRFLALLALAHAPKPPRLVCFEEPENGVHPGKLKFIIDTLRAISIPTERGIACQVLVNSHSPYLVDQLEPSEAILVTSEKEATRFSAIEQDIFTQKPHIRTMLEEGEQTLGELWAEEGLAHDN